MDRQEILLKEYELCQQDIIDTSSRYWTIVSIFMAVSTAILGAIATGLISGNFISQAIQRHALPQTLVVGSFVFVLGGGIITILVFLMKWLDRVNCLTVINYERMREIETELGMRKNLRVDFNDKIHDKKISIDPRAKPTQYKTWWGITSKKNASPNTKVNKAILWTLIAIWAVVVLGAISLMVCPLVITQ